MTRYLTMVEVLALHRWSLEQFGGLDGVTDSGLLDSAVNQPRATFGGQDLYLTVKQKAAALAFSIAKNHAFNDGNKRAALWTMLTFLRLNGFDFRCELDACEESILRLASGEQEKDEFFAWVDTHSHPR